MAYEFPEIFIDTLEADDPEEWLIVRECVQAVCKKVAPTASCYSEFEMEFDPETLQRKITPALYGEGDEANKIHSWMCGIVSADQIGSDGQASEFVGPYAFTWILGIDLEGFFDITGEDVWHVVEQEIQKIQMMFFRNQDLLLEKAKFYPINWTAIDLEAFSNGEQAIIAKGSMRVDLQVSISI